MGPGAAQPSTSPSPLPVPVSDDPVVGVLLGLLTASEEATAALRRLRGVDPGTDVAGMDPEVLASVVALTASMSAKDIAHVASVVGRLGRTVVGVQTALLREVVTRGPRGERPALVKELGYSSAGLFAEQVFGLRFGQAKDAVRLAEATAPRDGYSQGVLPPKFMVLAQATDAGEISVDQATPVLTGLPAHTSADVNPEVLTVAEASLVGAASNGAVGIAPEEHTEPRNTPNIPGTPDNTDGPDESVGSNPGTGVGAGVLIPQDAATARKAILASLGRDGASLAGDPRVVWPVGSGLGAPEATRYRPQLLDVMAKTWAKIADQDGAEPREREHHRKRSLLLTHQRDGMWKVVILAPEVEGAQLKTVLEAITPPPSQYAFAPNTTTGVSGSGGNGRSANNTDDPAHHDNARDEAGEALLPGLRTEELPEPAPVEVAFEARTRDQAAFDAFMGVIGHYARSPKAPTVHEHAPTLLTIFTDTALNATTTDNTAGAGSSNAPGGETGGDASASRNGTIRGRGDNTARPARRGWGDPPPRWGAVSADPVTEIMKTKAWLPATNAYVPLSSIARYFCDSSVRALATDQAGAALKLGQSQYPFNKHQRLVLITRDRHCRAPGCTMPAGYCEAHHLLPYDSGGPTDINNAILLCTFHHHLAHTHHS